MKISADDYGLSPEENKYILFAYKLGIINSICIMPNARDFSNIINDVKKFKDITFYIHLNISEGKAVSKNKLKYLTDNDNNFKISFFKAFIMSYNKEFLNEVYNEYKSQIEVFLNEGIIPQGINSHIHIHAIPNIFKIVCRLAKEYNIEMVRTNYEKFYLVNDFKLLFNIKFFVNIIKNVVLKIFTLINMKEIKKYGLETNKYLIGVLYTTMMNELVIKKGVETCHNENNLEAILHFVPNNLEYKMLNDRKNKL